MFQLIFQVPVNCLIFFLSLFVFGIIL